MAKDIIKGIIDKIFIDDNQYDKQAFRYYQPMLEKYMLHMMKDLPCKPRVYTELYVGGANVTGARGGFLDISITLRESDGRTIFGKLDISFHRKVGSGGVFIKNRHDANRDINEAFEILYNQNVTETIQEYLHRPDIVSTMKISYESPADHE